MAGYRRSKADGQTCKRQGADRLTVANVQRAMAVSNTGVLQKFNRRRDGSLRPEKLLAHVVVNANNFPFCFVQKAHTGRADQATGTCNEGFHSS